MSLIYNNISYAFDATKSLELMDIHKFIDTFQYPVDKLYIDKFWTVISNDAWVVVDYPMLKDIGYASERERRNKEKYLKLLSSRFERSKDYEVVSEEELHNRPLEGAVFKDDSINRDLEVAVLEKSRGPSGGVVIVQGRVFKKSLMMLHTKPAERIRDYYLTLEEIMIDYLRYTQFVTTHNSQLAIKALEAQVAQMQFTFNVDKSPVARNEFVYVLTNKINYARHMFKIGKSNDPKGRLVSYNTGSPIKDEDMFYIAKIPCCHAASLEKYFHVLLSKFHHNKEWFHIPQQDMKTIIDMANHDVSRWSDGLDKILQRGFENIDNIPLKQFHNQPALDQPIAKPTDKPYLRLKHEPGVTTKLIDVQAIYPDLTARK